MAHRPIIFSAAMIQALIAGRKSQTRRVLTQPSVDVTGCGRFADSRVGLKDEWEWLTGDPTDIDEVSAAGSFKTRFLEGDRLWVREAWRTFVSLDDVAPRDLLTPERGAGIAFEAGGGMSLTKPPARDRYIDYGLHGVREPVGAWGRLRAAMHLPRWGSRNTLVVTDVRVQRVQEISRDDAMAEGIVQTWGDLSDHDRETWALKPYEREQARCEGGFASHFYDNRTSVENYALLWKSIHGADAWERNPWVAVIEFKTHLANIDNVEVS